MNAAELIKSIKAKQLKPVYLLHGEEPYFIDLVGEALEQSVVEEMHKGFDESIFYGKDIDMASLVNACKRYPMMSPYQLIVVKEAQDLKWKSDSDLLLSYVENFSPNTVLVLEYKYGKFDSRKKLFKAIHKVGQVLDSKKLYDNQVNGWIESFVKEKGFKIHPQASMLLAEFLGTQLSKVANELNKLLLNVPKDREISTKDVEENIGISKDFNAFEFAKVLGQRNVFKAVQIVDYFAANPKDNPIVPMFGVVSGYFTRILKYHYLTDKSKFSVAKELGVNPFFVEEYALAARNYSKSKVFHVFSQLRKYDLKCKGVEVGALTTDADLLREMVFHILR